MPSDGTFRATSFRRFQDPCMILPRQMSVDSVTGGGDVFEVRIVWPALAR